MLRLFRGEDIVIVRQSTQIWDEQYRKGVWDRLTYLPPNTRYLAEVIRNSGVKNIFDIGCGNGGIAKALLPFSEGVRYTGIDISEVAIAQGRKIAPSARWIIGDLAHPPEDINQAEMIIFNEVLYYVDLTLVLPVYALRAKKEAIIVISILRSWRTPFLWRRIRRLVSIQKVQQIYGDSNIFDIGLGAFKK